MGTFNTKKILYGSASLIPTIANNICTEFQREGYEVAMDEMSSGGYDISITKGGVFKAVLGLKTALKVTLLPQNDNISFAAGVGIFGKMVIPTLIMLYVAWPVLLTQIWGMVQQSKIDDKALSIAERVIHENAAQITAPQMQTGCVFCTACGTRNISTAKFCCECGKSL